MTEVLQFPASQFDPGQYPAQLAEKQRALANAFAPLSDQPLEVYPSAPEHYRMRAEFRIWHDRDSGQCRHVMFEPGKPGEPVTIERFPIAHKAIDTLMPRLLAAINQSDELRHRLFQVEYLCTSASELLVTLIYHRQLDEPWVQQAKAIEEQFGIHLIGRARRQRLVLQQDYVTETLSVNGSDYRLVQPENSFTQPNAGINGEMVAWVERQLASSTTPGGADLLELYCGNGNFTIPLAGHFRQVLATEISKRSIAAAQENCQLNSVDNIFFARLSSEETSAALRRERPFRRLQQIDLDALALHTLLVDPPRAGLDEASRSLASGFERVIYISCNPQTLLRDLQHLLKTHTICANALFDQFPYTPHCECGVILVKRD